MSNILVFLVPALISVVLFKVFFKKEITTKEFGIHAFAALIITGAIYGISMLALYSSLYDTEILNGFVSKKYKDTIICTEFSSCRNYHYKTEYYYTTEKGKLKRKSRQVKVFDYPTEYNWEVETSIGNNFEIDRIDRRGSYEPPAFTAIKIGEYAAGEHTYVNPLLMSGVSLFNTETNRGFFSEEDLKNIPDYPKLQGVYKFDPFVNSTSYNTGKMRNTVNNVMTGMGASKQVNIVYVLYNPEETGSKYPEKILHKWNGGKKNDVIVFFGLSNSNEITEFKSFSYAGGMGNELLHSTLLMHFSGSEVFDEKSVSDVLNLVDQNFKRLPSSEFKYLIREVQPSPLLSLLIVALVCAVGVFFVRHDVR